MCRLKRVLPVAWLARRAYFARAASDAHSFVLLGRHCSSQEGDKSLVWLFGLVARFARSGGPLAASFFSCLNFADSYFNLQMNTSVEKCPHGFFKLASKFCQRRAIHVLLRIVAESR